MGSRGKPDTRDDSDNAFTLEQAGFSLGREEDGYFHDVVLSAAWPRL